MFVTATVQKPVFALRKKVNIFSTQIDFKNLCRQLSIFESYNMRLGP